MNERKIVEWKLKELENQWRPLHLEWLRAQKHEQYSGEERKLYFALAQIEVQHRDLSLKLRWLDEMEAV